MSPARCRLISSPPAKSHISGCPKQGWTPTDGPRRAAGHVAAERVQVHRLRENAGAVDVELIAEDLEEITAAADKVDVQGERYPAHMQRWINR
jgi:hypothetical protein